MYNKYKHRLTRKSHYDKIDILKPNSSLSRAVEGMGPTKPGNQYLLGANSHRTMF